MSLRCIPASFDPQIVAAIDKRLTCVERDNDVAIGLAIESGSRAWGFASPDSDYDCRFLYVARRERYLSLWPDRDVIETALDGLLDVNGWNVAKALRLICKGNAVVIEWLCSPVVYRGDDEFRSTLERFAREAAPVDAVRRHYLHLGQGQWRRHGDAEISVKKVFYALRPAAALRWMRLHDEALPPMHFPTLMAECQLDAASADAVETLLARKAVTRELGQATVPAPIVAFIEAEYALAASDTSEPRVHASEAANVLFRGLIDRFAPA